MSFGQKQGVTKVADVRYWNLTMIKLQAMVLVIVEDWVKHNKTPITFRYMADRLPEVKISTLRASAGVLCKKGYLRRSFQQGEVTYVLIRCLH